MGTDFAWQLTAWLAREEHTAEADGTIGCSTASDLGDRSCFDLGTGRMKIIALIGLLLVAIGVLTAGCADTKEPITRTPNDKCLVRACSVLY